MTAASGADHDVRRTASGRDGGEAAGGRSLIVVIPCLDEAPTVARVVGGVPRRIDGIGRIEVVVIDDGSTDGTAEAARAAGADVIRHPANLGLGATFREAVAVALARGAEVMVHIDGDGQFDPADIPKLVAEVLVGGAHMATASRFADPALAPAMPWVKRWGNRGVARIVRLLTGHRFRDVSCGFRAFSREALLRMNPLGGFTYTQETFLDLIFKDLRIVEVPVRVRGTREFGTSRIAASLPRYAFRSLQIMLRAFMSYRPFSFFMALSGIFFAIAVGFVGFLALHYWNTGRFSPHIWSGFIGGAFAFLGVTTLVTGFLGDMLVHIRMNQENILYHLKRDRNGDAQAANAKAEAAAGRDGGER